MTAVAGLALLLPAAPVALAAAPAEDPAPTTTITFRVSNCEGCTLQGTTVTSTTGPAYDGPKAKIKNGAASMVVPTAQTRGMTFWLDPVKDAGLDARPLVAFQYDRAAAGTPVVATKARNAKYARPCWSGTTEATARLSIRVRWTKPFEGALDGQGMSRAPIAWVTPSQAALKPAQKVAFPRNPNLNGVLAAQDYIVCDAS